MINSWGVIIGLAFLVYGIPAIYAVYRGFIEFTAIMAGVLL